MTSPYVKSILSRKIQVRMNQMSNLNINLEHALMEMVANKCTEDGYICPNQIEIIQHSVGMIEEENVIFQVVFSCFVANPIEGDMFEARVKTVTLAGVHAEVMDDLGNIPITVFVARDVHRRLKIFDSIQENQTILVKIIGTRYEKNDPCIYAIADMQLLPETPELNTPLAPELHSSGMSPSPSLLLTNMDSVLGEF